MELTTKENTVKLTLDGRPETSQSSINWKTRCPVIFNINNIKYLNEAINQKTVEPVIKLTLIEKIKKWIGL
jgi:hypothetical protein